MQCWINHKQQLNNNNLETVPKCNQKVPNNNNNIISSCNLTRSGTTYSQYYSAPPLSI